MAEQAGTLAHPQKPQATRRRDGTARSEAPKIGTKTRVAVGRGGKDEGRKENKRNELTGI